MAVGKREGGRSEDDMNCGSLTIFRIIEATEPHCPLKQLVFPHIQHRWSAKWKKEGGREEKYVSFAFKCKQIKFIHMSSRIIYLFALLQILLCSFPIKETYRNTHTHFQTNTRRFLLGMIFLTIVRSLDFSSKYFECFIMKNPFFKSDIL